MYASMLKHPYSLFGQFDRLRREFDDVFGAAGLTNSIRSVAPGTLPAVNVGRTPNSIEVYAFVPGLDASRIDVTLDRGILQISGERSNGIPSDDPKVNVFALERGSGKFSRAIALPDDIDHGQVDARYRDGVLQVSIARRESAQPKRIAIQ
jgi:HSP20 family protein